MNIYIQPKTAKKADVLKQIEEPLNPTVDKLFCWNVALINKYSHLYNEVNMLIIKNAATEYCIFVPFVKTLDHNLFKLIENYIHSGLNQLDCRKEILDNYFKKAGEFQFGILNNASTKSTLRNNAIVAYDKYLIPFEEISSNQKKASLEVTEKYNSKTHYLNHNKSYSEIMKEALTDLNNNERKGQKAFELLITLDVELYKATRRIIVPAEINFYELHKVLISLFKWWDYHLASFEFFNTEVEYTYWQRNEKELLLLPDDEQPDLPLMDDYKLDELLEKYKSIFWVYDYGDHWQHRIEILNKYENYTGELPYLLEAEYNAPPEDVGGTGGFEEFLNAISDPNHEDYNSYKLWRPNWKKDLTKKEKTPHKIIYLKRDNRRLF